MTGKSKSEENKNTKRANSSSFRILALIPVLIVAVIVGLVKYNPQLFDSFFKEKSSPAGQILVEDNSLDKTASEESYSPGPEVPLLSFSPDENELDIENGDLTASEDMGSEASHPYEIEVEKDKLAERIK